MSANDNRPLHHRETLRSQSCSSRRQALDDIPLNFLVRAFGRLRQIVCPQAVTASHVRGASPLHHILRHASGKSSSRPQALNYALSLLE
eukprot:9302942-Pyramimonas_sp.AAC.1